jgi:enoyl-CoA hydratase/carnithine racemase
MTTVRFEQDHGVGTIVLANPPSNRIGSQFAVDLRTAVHDASLSDSRVLVIRSDSPNFCMGGQCPRVARKERRLVPHVHRRVQQFVPCH